MAPDAAATIAVRAGEEVDALALLDWMRVHVSSELPNDAACRVRQFPAGFSNLTYFVEIGDGDDAQRFVLRRPPRGVKPGVAHDMGREHGILAALQPRGIPVPSPVARCDDPGVIGAPFYLMEFVGGNILRNALPDSVGHDEAVRMPYLRELSRTFVSTLVQLHALDVSQGELAHLGKPEGYVQRQVEGWTRRWQAAKTDDVPALDAVASWLGEHQPPVSSRVALVHNDFKFDNLVLTPDGAPRVRAILDWEMATVGDPLMDLGTTLAYWVEADDSPVLRSLGLGVTALPGAMTRNELIDEYARTSGADVSNIAFYHAFGLFKVAIIAQQIYARHVQGLTADPRFGRLPPVIRALGATAEGVSARL